MNDFGDALTVKSFGESAEKAVMRDSSGLLRRRVHPADGRTIWEFMAEETALGEPLDAWPLRVLRDKNLGRMVIADRDLAAGELVFEEEPLCRQSTTAASPRIATIATVLSQKREQRDVRSAALNAKAK